MSEGKNTVLDFPSKTCNDYLYLHINKCKKAVDDDFIANIDIDYLIAAYIPLDSSYSLAADSHKMRL